MVKLFFHRISFIFINNFLAKWVGNLRYFVGSKLSIESFALILLR